MRDSVISMKRLCLFVALCAACTPVAPSSGDDIVVDDECADGGVAVGFPLRPGDYTIGQGNGGAFSHSGVNAFGFDFTVDEGTDVIAARSGTVVFVVDGFGPGGADANLAAKANIIVIDHGAGTFDSYFHLQAGSVALGVGDTVNSGQFLARSGNSGFTSAPHLHFAVVDAAMQSLPACFQPGDLVPATNDVVSAVVSPLSDPGVFPRSTLAADTFADAGVVIDNEIVAFALAGTLHVEGHVTDGNSRAAIYLAAYGGFDAVAQVVVDVDADGAFVADLAAGALRGVFTLGMSSVKADNGFGGRTVPVFLTP